MSGIKLFTIILSYVAVFAAGAIMMYAFLWLLAFGHSSMAQ